MRIRRASALVAERWRQLSLLPKRVLLRRVGLVASVCIVGSLVLARFTWGSSGPGIATPFAFAALFLAAVALMGVVVVHSQDLVEELEASHPPQVRDRGRVARAVNPMLWTVSARGRRAFRVWRARVGSTLRREATRESIARRIRDLGSSLSGVPSEGRSPEAGGPLARPRSPHAARPAETDRRGSPDRSPVASA